MDLGLLLLRIALAAILFMHSTQKLLGWFSGPGLERQGNVFHAMGHRPGRQMVLLASASEAIGCFLVVIGLATPLGAAMIAGTMIVAGMTLTIAKGTLWNVAGGGEYPLVLATFAVVLGFTGPGRWSVDSAIGAPWYPKSNAAAAVVGVIVLVVAVLAAIPPLLRLRANLAADAAAAPAPPSAPASA
jgi:putative oxidoreductase